VCKASYKEEKRRRRSGLHPRYKQTFLDYDRPFDPYPLSFWDTNPDLMILDEEAEEEDRIARLEGQAYVYVTVREVLEGSKSVKVKVGGGVTRVALQA
jgi:hypothetical protein